MCTLREVRYCFIGGKKEYLQKWHFLKFSTLNDLRVLRVIFLFLLELQLWSQSAMHYYYVAIQKLSKVLLFMVGWVFGRVWRVSCKIIQTWLFSFFFHAGTQGQESGTEVLSFECLKRLPTKTRSLLDSLIEPIIYELGFQLLLLLVSFWPLPLSLFFQLPFILISNGQKMTVFRPWSRQK